MKNFYRGPTRASTFLSWELRGKRRPLALPRALGADSAAMRFGDLLRDEESVAGGAASHKKLCYIIFMVISFSEDS